LRTAATRDVDGALSHAMTRGSLRICIGQADTVVRRNNTPWLIELAANGLRDIARGRVSAHVGGNAAGGCIIYRRCELVRFDGKTVAMVTPTA
jgi:hypothetical protein